MNTYVEENAAARRRGLSLVGGLTAAQMANPLEGGWTIGAELAHMAFWDRVHAARLRAALDSGGELPARLAPGVTDAMNDSGLHGWRMIPGAAAVDLFAEASSEVDAFLGSLDRTVVEHVYSAGLPRLIERHHHRTEHGDAIERAILHP